MAAGCFFFLMFALLEIGCGFPESPVGDPIPAVQGLVGRLLGNEYVDKFQYEVIANDKGYDVFEVDSSPSTGKPILRGSTGVSLASALNYYLKYYCNCSVSWGRNGTGDQLKLPEPLILPKSQTRYVSPVKYRYYQNVCTVSYSMAWWDFKRWEREIDWMALNGINLPLSFTGQEYVWQKLYTKLGLTDKEIKTFFSGGAFLAWQRMGNLRGWGGPLDDGWIKQQHDIQLQILQRSRSFGIINVLPGFSGHVPVGIQRVFPNASLTRNSRWGNFNETYTDDYLLEPNDPLFKKIGAMFYELLIEEFGTDHYYNTDTYNEMNPSSADSQFLADTNKAIYDTMHSVDNEAVYVMQGYLFHSGFWSDTKRIEAFLSAVPDDGMIILDLNCEASPLWLKTNSFFNKPFIWCLLHNFGGTRCIYGNLTKIATSPVIAEQTPNNTMIGTGITPEAIEHNPVVYDLMNEMGWRREEVNVSDWLKYYASRRYGGYSPLTEEAWDILHYCAYSRGGQIKSTTVTAPQLNMQISIGMDATGIADAWILLYRALALGQVPSVGPLHYDIVDIGRQCLDNLYCDMYRMYVLAYEMQGDGIKDVLTSISNEMKLLLTNIDDYLGTDTNFLLGHWINDARSSAPANSANEVLDNLEFNARNQITMWGPDENIEDYAAKEWSGLFKDYYLPRWDLFMQYVMDSVDKNQPFDNNGYRAKRLELEQQFSSDIKSYPVEPTGDLVTMTGSLLNKYFPDISQNYYEVLKTDIEGNNLFGGNYGPWTRNINQVAYLCNINPSCVGFTSEGYLKNSTSNQISSSEATLYLKIF